jgi:hypothetical protein
MFKNDRYAVHSIVETNQLGFSPVDYSKFKYGDISIAQKFGNELFDYFQRYIKHEKKIEMLELKEAKLAEKKQEKIKEMQELALEETTQKLAHTEETPFERFEFNLVEYNS